MRITQKITRKNLEELRNIISILDIKNSKGKFIYDSEDYFDGSDTEKVGGNERCSWIYTYTGSRIYFDNGKDFAIVPFLAKDILPEDTFFQRLKKKLILKELQKQVDKINKAIEELEDGRKKTIEELEDFRKKRNQKK